MGSGRVRLDGNRIVALAGISSLEADRALAADGEQRDVRPCFTRRRAGRAGNLRGSPAACVQHIKKFARIRCQHLDGIDPAEAKGELGTGIRLPKLLSILKPEI